MKIKSLVLLALAALSLASCKKDDKDKGKLDPNAKITVTGMHSLTKTDTNPVEIEGTGITDSLEYITKYAYEYQTNNSPDGVGIDFGFQDNYYNLRDIENNKLKFFGVRVIDYDGNLGSLVTTDLDVVLAVGRSLDNPTNPIFYPLNTWPGEVSTIPDTVAYIPNSVVLEARSKITAAFEAEDYATCYKLFDEAYIFIPTTGPKWRAMQKAGNN